MIVTEIYTVIAAILKMAGVISWPWAAILIPEAIWMIVYVLFVLACVRVSSEVEHELTKDEWRGLM